MVSSQIRAALLCALLLSCKRGEPAAPAEASAPSSQPSTSVSNFLNRILDAGPPPDAGLRDAGASVEFDAGVSSCRLLYGPVEQPLTGPIALVESGAVMEVVGHKNGVVKSTTFPVEPIAGSKPTGRKALGATAEKASRPPCAVTGPLSFCPDANGDVHRALRAKGGDAVVAATDPGSRITAAQLGGRAVLGYLTARTTTEGRVSEAFARLDDQEPVRISESGSGATEVVFTSRGDEIVALMIDARRAMSPVHARILTVKNNKLAVGPDNVVYVGGGSDHQMRAALVTDSKGNTFGLLPTAAEEGFGLVSIRIDTPPKMEEPHVTSLYPNGLDFSAVAATHGVEPMVVIRVRPATRDISSQRLLEIGKLEAQSGAFTSLGFIPTTGAIPYLALEADHFGAVWIAYVDGNSTWLERRSCP
jgi:hypothetical protein